jgi:hypothetical protein
MSKSIMLLVAILVIAAQSDLCAQFRRAAEFKPFDTYRTEINTSYALVGGDEYLMLNASLPATKFVTVGVRACARLNRQQASSWTTQFQRIYSSMYYAYSKIEYGLELSHNMQMNASGTVGLGVADRFDDIPCYWESAVQPVLLVHPEVSMLMKMTHNFHTSISFGVMHSPTLEKENLMQIPKPLLGFNIRMYPWLKL